MKTPLGAWLFSLFVSSMSVFILIESCGFKNPPRLPTEEETSSPVVEAIADETDDTEDAAQKEKKQPPKNACERDRDDYKQQAEYWHQAWRRDCTDIEE